MPLHHRCDPNKRMEIKNKGDTGMVKKTNFQVVKPIISVGYSVIGLHAAATSC